jgi:hypothetical protein
VEFLFLIDFGDETEIGVIAGGETEVGLVVPGDPFTFTELSNPGWELADASCETGPGVSIAEVEGGVLC